MKKKLLKILRAANTAGFVAGIAEKVVSKQEMTPGEARAFGLLVNRWLVKIRERTGVTVNMHIQFPPSSDEETEGQERKGIVPEPSSVPMPDEDSMAMILAEQLRVRSLMVDLCDLVLSDVNAFKDRPADVIGAFVQKHPEATEAQIGHTIHQLRQLHQISGEDGVRQFRESLVDESKCN